MDRTYIASEKRRYYGSRVVILRAGSTEIYYGPWGSTVAEQTAACRAVGERFEVVSKGLLLIEADARRASATAR